jgi:hypothetical protein
MPKPKRPRLKPDLAHRLCDAMKELTAAPPHSVALNRGLCEG